MGTKHAEVQEKLFGKGNSLSSLNMALETARTFEATKDQQARLQAKKDVHAIHTAESEWKCEKCGTHHAKLRAACPAKGQKCNTCGYVGHWAVMCKTKRSTRKPRWVNKSVHAVKEDTEESPRDNPHCLVFETVSVDIHQITPTRKHEVHAAVSITLDNTRGAAKLRGKIDTKIKKIKILIIVMQVTLLTLTYYCIGLPFLSPSSWEGGLLFLCVHITCCSVIFQLAVAPSFWNIVENIKANFSASGGGTLQCSRSSNVSRHRQ